MIFFKHNNNIRAVWCHTYLHITDDYWFTKVHNKLLGTTLDTAELNYRLSMMHDPWTWRPGMSLIMRYTCTNQRIFQIFTFSDIVQTMPKIKINVEASSCCPTKELCMHRFAFQWTYKPKTANFFKLKHNYTITGLEKSTAPLTITSNAGPQQVMMIDSYYGKKDTRETQDLFCEGGVAVEFQTSWFCWLIKLIN